MRPRVLIFGSGAMACFMGARLARSGLAGVTLAGRWRQGIERIASSGIRVLEEGADWQTRVEAIPLTDPLPEADLVLVLVKSTETARVARAAARALQPDGLAVTLQNGLGNAEALASAIGASRVAQGVTLLGATLLAPGLVRGFPGRVILGTPSPARQRLRQLALLLAGSGFPVEIAEDLAPDLWRKLAANCAINPLSALRRLPNGELLTDPETRGLLQAAAREVAEVARAQGVDVGPDVVAATEEVARQTALNRSSMLQDVEAGRPTEIESLNGAVVRAGRSLGVPTPVNASLLQGLRRLTAASLSPGRVPLLAGRA